MLSKQYAKMFAQILVALVLIISSILMMIPATRDSILTSIGILEKPVYNGFEPFVPFVPGYFPEDFDLIHVSNSQSISDDLAEYTEVYATETQFFKTIQRQGRLVPRFTEYDLIIQGVPAGIDPTNPVEWLRKKELAGYQFDPIEGWVISFELKEVHIQVVTNLPKEEALLVAEGLVPSICTSKPTAVPEE